MAAAVAEWPLHGGAPFDRMIYQQWRDTASDDVKQQVGVDTLALGTICVCMVHKACAWLNTGCL